MANNQKDFEYPLPKGTILNGGHLSYRVEETLGQGGFGITYKVSAKITIGHIKSTMMFAVKEHFVKGRCHRAPDGIRIEYSEEAATDVESSLRSFIAEGRRLNNICKLNRNIVDVNEVFEANNTAYYVMEYLDGGDLCDMIKNNNGGISEAKALSIIRPIAKAVESLHRERLLHLDIKPENIAMRQDENGHTSEPVLIDFGLAAHFDSNGKRTTTNKILGYSERYSPIEQFGGITTFSPEVDVYSLGATLYYMLTGKDPARAFDIWPGYVEKTLPLNVSELTRKAVAKAMKNDKYERTQTAQAFLDSLEGHFEERRSLNNGYILHGRVNTYRIISVEDEGENCFVYKAQIYTGTEPQNRGNTEVLDIFNVYEFYTTAGNVKRRNDGTLDDLVISGEPLKNFMLHAERATGLNTVGTAIQKGERTECEMFDANNTIYCVVNSRWHKPIIKPITNWEFPKISPETKRKIATIGISAAAVGLIFWVTIPQARHNNDTEKTNGAYVTEKKDSAKIDTTGIVKNSQQSEQATADPRKSSNKKENEKEGNYTKTEEKTRPNEPTRTDELTNEQKFDKAVAAKDISTLKDLANKGYAKAYSKLASLYLDNNNYSQADAYARKALNANIGRQEALIIVEILDKKIGYYDNGEHGSKPE